MKKDQGEVSMSGKTSSSRVPPLYAPSFAICHGKNYKKQTFFTITDGRYHVKNVPELRQVLEVSSSLYGWFLIGTYQSTHSYLFDPVSLKKILLPQVPPNNFVTCVLTAPPDDPDCFVVFISIVSKSFIYCRIGDNDWVEKGLLSKNEMSKLSLFCIRAISCGGKVYAFSIPYAVIIIDVHDNFSTTLYEWETLPHSIPETTRISHYYLESRGEIFHVALYHLRLSHEIITLDVWKICLSTMDYVKVENIGDRIFLLGNSSVSYSSSELEIKGNCIYFFTNETYLNRFDMEDGTITTTNPGAKKFSQWKGPFWIVPNCKRQGKRVEEQEQATNYPKIEHENANELMPELVELIMSRVFLADCIRMRLTSKAWLTITPPIRSFTLVEGSEHHSDQIPWLLSFPKNKKGMCNLRHPIYSDTYLKEIPELEGAIVRHVKYGWWLMTQGTSIFFFNPSTREIIKLPDYIFHYGHVSISFSSPPTSPGYIVFGHGSSSEDIMTMIVYHEGEDDWSTIFIDTPSFTFIPSDCSPVFCDGVLYCLGKDGKLGIFYPKETNKNDKWKLQPKAVIPEAVSPSRHALDLTSSRSFIVEHDNEILSVFAGVWGRSVSVYKLDKSEMKWIKLESLGDRVMFVSNAASLLVPAGLKGIENRIYFPRFNGNDNVYYSLSTGKYHCFSEKDPRTSWLGSSKNWNCVWIQSSSTCLL